MLRASRQVWLCLRTPFPSPPPCSIFLSLGLVQGRLTVLKVGGPPVLIRGLLGSADSPKGATSFLVALAERLRSLLIGSLGFLVFAEANPVAQERGGARLVTHHPGWGVTSGA